MGAIVGALSGVLWSVAILVAMHPLDQAYSVAKLVNHGVVLTPICGMIGTLFGTLAAFGFAALKAKDS
jgi:hypothetical protein